MKIVLTVGDLVYNVHFFFFRNLIQLGCAFQKNERKHTTLFQLCMHSAPKERTSSWNFLRQKKKKLTSGILVNVCYVDIFETLSQPVGVKAGSKK